MHTFEYLNIYLSDDWNLTEVVLFGYLLRYIVYGGKYVLFYISCYIDITKVDVQLPLICDFC